jgi:hypothetical protein
MAMFINGSGIYVIDSYTGINAVPKVAYLIDASTGTGKVIPYTPSLTYDFLRSPHPPISFLPTMVQDVPTMVQVNSSYSSVFPEKIYVLNPDNATVSIRHCRFQGPSESCIPIQNHIVVGEKPGPIAINDKTHLVYIGYPESGGLSVINGFTDRVAVGAIFNVNPPDSGVIKCNDRIYPTNTYIYVDSGADCTAQNNKGFEFNTWVESPLTNRNSTTPIVQSSDHPETIAVDRYGIFTANFKLPHQLTTEELFTYLTGAISAAVAINGALLVVPGWRRARKQRTHLRECIKMIDDDAGKSHKDAIEDKIMGYYVDGKLSEDHRQLLNDKISDYYGSVKGSESLHA